MDSGLGCRVRRVTNLNENPTVTDEPPPPPPPIAQKPLLRFDARGIAGLFVAAIALGALAFLIVTDLGLQSKVHNLNHQVSSGTSSLASADAMSSALAASDSADQLQIASLKSQIPTQPKFQVVSSGWTKGCSADSCYPEASVINYGQTGQAVAVFEIYSGTTTTGSVLAQCSSSIASTAANGAADASCSASSAGLIEYFQSHPTGEVSLQVLLQNP